MIFSVQRFLEDHFARRGLEDVDQYAVRAANAFDRLGPGASERSLARELGRVRTVFFRRNDGLERKEFEEKLAATLRRRFQKKTNNPTPRAFLKSIAPARKRLGARRSISSLLREFKAAVESRAVNEFWLSRRKRKLRHRPEGIAQALLAVFAKGVVGTDGLVLREMASGIGFVDVGVSFGHSLHIVELKVLKGGFTGPAQLGRYMRNEQRHEGWLVLVDTRRNDKRAAIPAKVSVASGTVRTVVVDVNPEAPHSA